MYSIGQIAKLTGITAFTLRYYEKIGVLPKPGRQDGIRRYDDQDLRYIRFIHGLKQTGMSLEDIAAFTEDGCLLSITDRSMDVSDTLQKRITILSQHIEQLDEQIIQLESVKSVAQEKSSFYSALLKEQASKPAQEVQRAKRPLA